MDSHEGYIHFAMMTQCSHLPHFAHIAGSSSNVYHLSAQRHSYLLPAAIASQLALWLTGLLVSRRRAAKRSKILRCARLHWASGWWHAAFRTYSWKFLPAFSRALMVIVLFGHHRPFRLWGHPAFLAMVAFKAFAGGAQCLYRLFFLV